MPYDFSEARKMLTHYLNLIKVGKGDILGNYLIEDLQAYYFAGKQLSTLYELPKGSQPIIGGLVIGNNIFKPSLC